jgi:hypothetical protein
MHRTRRARVHLRKGAGLRYSMATCFAVKVIRGGDAGALCGMRAPAPRARGNASPLLLRFPRTSRRVRAPETRAPRRAGVTRAAAGAGSQQPRAAASAAVDPYASIDIEMGAILRAPGECRPSPRLTLLCRRYLLKGDIGPSSPGGLPRPRSS